MATSSSDVDFDTFDFDSLANTNNFINNGAFGAVYGPFTWSSKTFAFKQILINQEKLDAFKIKEEHKKKIWTELKHKQLIEIHYVSLKPKAVHIVMEYASGGSLRRLLDDSDVAVQHQIVVLNWATQIAEGMQYLHNKGIVHRDLKSSNIVLMEPFDSLNAHEEMTLKITDFDEVQEHTGTATMSFRGTCAYMAPEVLDTQRFSKASDVWSYGIVMWEMLTRDLPHKGVGQVALMQKAVAGKLSLSVPDSVPAAYKELLCDCWCSDKHSRPPFTKIVDQLNSIYTDEKKLRHKWDPVLVKTIRTKASEEAKKAISGLTILNKELFVVSEKSSEVEVYSLMEMSLSRQWNLKELICLLDIAACKRNKCLYINDYKAIGQLKEILRVDSNGNLINKWSTGDDWGWGLSVTHESNVILTVYHKNKLNEYSPDGQLIRELNLSSGICNPWHAIKLTNNHFIVSHGSPKGHLHRVCKVDAYGKLEKSFGGECGCSGGQMNQPAYLSIDGSGFVMVTDRENGRVLLLDPDLEFLSLEFQREILAKEGKDRLQKPKQILLDKASGRIFLVDNELNNQRVLIFKFN